MKSPSQSCGTGRGSVNRVSEVWEHLITIQAECSAGVNGACRPSAPRAIEQRQARSRIRHQLGRVAAILCGPGEERSCLVKDFSDGGVRLQLNGFEIPDDFALVFAPNELAQSGRYKVVWRLGNDVGAKFLGPTT
jgi:hypothetical protein